MVDAFPKSSHSEEFWTTWFAPTTTPFAPTSGTLIEVTLAERQTLHDCFNANYLTGNPAHNSPSRRYQCLEQQWLFLQQAPEAYRPQTIAWMEALLAKEIGTYGIHDSPKYLMFLTQCMTWMMEDGTWSPLQEFPNTNPHTTETWLDLFSSSRFQSVSPAIQQARETLILHLDTLQQLGPKTSSATPSRARL